MGRHWDQPDRSKVLVDDTHAVVTAATFRALAEYSRTMPTGVYEGKMWKAKTAAGWMLRWYGPCDDPALVSNNQRILLVVE